MAIAESQIHKACLWRVPVQEMSCHIKAAVYWIEDCDTAYSLPTTAALCMIPYQNISDSAFPSSGVCATRHVKTAYISKEVRTFIYSTEIMLNSIRSPGLAHDGYLVSFHLLGKCRNTKCPSMMVVAWRYNNETANALKSRHWYGLVVVVP